MAALKAQTGRSYWHPRCSMPGMSARKHGIYNTKSRQTRRKELRNSSTAAEAVLWRHLQRRQMLNKKFRRQYSIGPYIVDFYCPECRLVIELDGAPHFSFLANEYETRRTQYLQSLGLRVLRFENRAVYNNLEFVLETILDALNDHPVCACGAATPPL